MASQVSKKGLPSRYAKIYDHFYGKFAKQKKYVITDAYKSEIISHIITYGGVSFNDLAIIDAFMIYKTPLHVTKVLKQYTIGQANKAYDIAVRHMYSPQNIAMAVNGYYNVKNGTKISEYDFGGKKYIVRALNKAGIEYREQLYKHLSNGWYYLWTIPGCGDAARQKILIAIDDWAGKKGF